MSLDQISILMMCISLLLLSFAVYYCMGKAICVRYRWNLTGPEVVCVGFFVYFALFQAVAEIMIFSKQKLHVLGWTWLGILVLWLAVCASILWQGREQKKGAKSGSAVKVRPKAMVRMLILIMIAAVAAECLSAVLMQRNIGWDFAYYIGNMVTSVQTDTMYLYDGSSGRLRNTLELRYALSGFYMNTAWISQMTGIHALFIQKYVVGVQGVILTNLVAYSFAMEAFKGDKGKSAMLVAVTVILTLFWDVYDTSAQFLMIRSYEAKAYCANVVLPMVVFLCYRIWNQADKLQAWAELFLVALASVAVSMSSLVLVPAAIVLMVLAHMIVSRQWNGATVRRTIYCVLPNLCYMLIFFANQMKWFVVEV